jgi:hypothetical protein
MEPNEVRSPRVAITAPCHIQPSEKWVKALWDEAKASGAHVIITDDSDGKISLPWAADGGGDVYGYARQKEYLGDELYAMFEQFHHSSACKNFGMYVAWKEGYDVVIVIDSDCVVPEGFVKKHLKSLNVSGSGWTNPIPKSGWYSRGFPYSRRHWSKWAHMGLWENELDLYGTDRMKCKDVQTSDPHYGEDEWPTDAQHFPFSGMNVSFIHDAIPFMLFLPNFKFKKEKFTRHDDIWGGYVFQKVAESKKKALSFGNPIVFHDTVVIPEEDAKDEEPMIAHEDEFYATIDDSLVFTGTGAELFEATELFSWLAREFAASPVFKELSEAFSYQAKLYS